MASAVNTVFILSPGCRQADFQMWQGHRFFFYIPYVPDCNVYRLRFGSAGHLLPFCFISDFTIFYSYFCKENLPCPRIIDFHKKLESINLHGMILVYLMFLLRHIVSIIYLTNWRRCIKTTGFLSPHSCFSQMTTAVWSEVNFDTYFSCWINTNVYTIFLPERLTYQ